MTNSQTSHKQTLLTTVLPSLRYAARVVAVMIRLPVLLGANSSNFIVYTNYVNNKPSYDRGAGKYCANGCANTGRIYLVPYLSSN